MRRRLLWIVTGAGIAIILASYLGIVIQDHMKQPALSEAVAKSMERPGGLRVDGSLVGKAPDSKLMKRPPVIGDRARREVLWLARCMYSETKRPVEQRLVAWVIRNRVETKYGGNDSYKEVILDPYQFSAFNPGSTFEHPEVHADSAVWRKTVKLARDVMRAPASDRPFSIITRHFYSERSMPDRRQPSWVGQNQALNIMEHKVDDARFRFYSGIM